MEALSAGATALHAGRWSEACAAYERALADEPTPAGLDGLAEALWWLGETSRSLDTRVRAHAQYRDTGDTEGAVGTAIAVATCYASNYGNRPAALGWVARAERLLQGLRSEALHGRVWALRGYLAEDLDLASIWLERALACARQVGDIDLELTSLADRGLVLVRAGRIDDGLALLDEAMAGALGGEPGRLDTVVIAGCDMLEACELAGDVGRARLWCEAADRFMRSYGCPFLYSSCRTHYGAILVSTGQWPQAESELAAAVRMTEDVGPAPRVRALCQLADLRLRQGRLEEAEVLVAQCGDDPSALLPAAAAKLCRGQNDRAAALLERLVRSAQGTRWGRARALTMLVQAQLATAGPDTAAETAHRIEALRTGRHDDPVSGLAASAAGQVDAARGATTQALAHLEHAHEIFARLGLPLEAARVRLDAARILAPEAPGRATDEAQAALAVFSRMGAARDADAAAALLRSLGVVLPPGPRGAGTLTVREQEVLRLLGAGLSNPEIAQRLFISRKTAAHHVSNVLSKLGVRNRAEAAACAARLDPQ